MATTASVSLTRMPKETAHIEIKGTAPLIVNRWSEKARRQMSQSQQGHKSPKQAKDPNADYEASMYRFADGGHGFPVMGFKAATVRGGARLFGKSVKMTELRQIFTFLSDGDCTDGTQLIRIGGSPIMREDMVRLNGKTSDVRYRAEYRDWSAILRIEFYPSMVDIDSVVALVDAGGTNGVGEWRPEKSGTFGTYEVVGA